MSAIPMIASREYGNIKLIRGLIWTYFFLLIFEGFLRMVLPSFANALLVVRDPFLLLMYLVAHISRAFPWNRFVVMFWVLGLTALVIGFFQNPGSPLVTLFGFRAAFLHLPMIFLMANVMDEQDVISMGRWFLILSVPIAILMAVQFNVGGDHWLNRGLDMQFEQIDSAGGKIRPPGTFTYSLGPSMFFSFVTAFLMYAQFHKEAYSKLLVGLSVSATCLGLAVSGSRNALALSAIVVLTAIFAVGFTRPKAVSGLVKFMFIVAIGVLVASQLSIFGEGVDVFSQRIANAGAYEGGFIGFLQRAFGEYIASYHAIGRAELTGAGLGVGSNAGASMLSGRMAFLLAESEWPRMILEMGPFIGIIFLGMRTGLTLWMFGRTLVFARAGFMLPVLIFGCTAMNLHAGLWGQATALGFTVIGGGLCLAAMKPRGIEVAIQNP